MPSYTFNDFIDELGLYHSSNRYDAVNSTNHLGRFQFGEAALIDIGMVRNDGKPFDNDFSGGWTGKHGINSKEEFLASHVAQDTAIHDFLGKQAHFLRNYLHYDGQSIDGQEISLSGLLGAAHLAGAGGVRRFLNSGGDYNPKDANGASLTDSLNHFNGYDVPYTVDPSRNYTFVGSNGPDTIRGYDGNDYFAAGAGRDTFDGGDGEDTIALSGLKSEFTITRGEAPATWEIARQLDDGRSDLKSLRNVELVRFEDDEIVDLRTMPSAAPGEEQIVAPQAGLTPTSVRTVRALPSTPNDPGFDEDVSVTPVGLPASFDASDMPIL
ncbi:hypothetical protein [Chelatococcus asaccharovorans]|uniref:Hemolysin type calcium-binding protein n=1 Tax=Chelatococcus asaccharovorans TaxID=28210 RepID=A0A2V3TY17_9HYPH|nr:hypothetical protein [Chelatococcus asaccharovorans]MBS7706762.1 hypothetical protein [Chelatococcus asaccharovorans]PXW54094.1 hypothetical protein C7450_112123 [Chelatococcus asaccharovorans]